MKTVSFSQNARTLFAIALTALAYAFATPASAQVESSCSGCTNTPTPSIGSSFQLGGAFGGFGQASATNGGPTYTTSTGGLNLNAIMNGLSDGCTTGCGVANFLGNGSVWQNTTAGALSQGAGGSAVQTLSNGAVRLTFGN